MITSDAKNVDEYIASFPADVQKRLKIIRTAIQKVAPEAEESISYQMPAYKFHGVLVYFAAFKNHIGFYATPSGHEAFQKELSKYKTGKGSVQFPLDQALPIDLITQIVQFKLAENLQKVQAKKKK